jgi:exopolysaccharide biosynthesis protein
MKSLALALLLLSIVVPQPIPPNPPDKLAPASGLSQAIYLPIIQTVPPPPPLGLNEWVNVGDGVDYQQFTLPDPNNVYVARMDRANPSVFLESSLGTGELVGGRETVSGMAQRYDQAINHWNNTWGGRNHVVVAINGDYFDPSSGNPQNGMLQSGWYIKRYNDYEGWSGFAWLADRSAFIGQCIVNEPGGQFVSFADPEKTQRINAVNALRQEGQLVLYTPQYASSTLTDSSGSEVVVELSAPLAATAPGNRVNGRVTAVRPDSGSTPIPYDSIVLSGQGQAGQDLVNSVQVGDEIGITQEIGSFGNDCKTPIPGDWTQAYAGIGGAFTFLTDGAPQHLDVTGAIVRHPRTAIAMNDQYIYFIVVDGRDPGVSVGMTFDELAIFAKEKLDASYGIAQDGGGSSTMVINGRVMNLPSDKCPMNSPNIVIGSPIDQDLQQPTSNPTPGSTPDIPMMSCERPVSNGMLMVTYEDKQQSQTFAPGSPVVALRPAAVYLGPGTNYGLLATAPAGASGEVLADTNGLDGVQAKGTNWWKVTIGGITGWVSEGDLSGQ